MLTDPFPLSVTPKVNSPQLLAWLAQFGDDKFVRAEDFNQIFDALAFLYENMGGGGTFNPADYDLDAFQNLASDPYVRLSQVLTSADLQAVQEGIAWKQPVELNLDSGVTLSGSIPTIASLTQQGVTLVNDSRVIVSGLPNQAFNGFFRVNSTPISGVYRLYRTNDANTTAELNNAVVGVTGGTHAGKTYRQSTLNPVIGTSNIVFTDFGSTVPNATSLIPGIMKLYPFPGFDEDGTMTQKSIFEIVNERRKIFTDIFQITGTSYTLSNNDAVYQLVTTSATDVTITIPAGLNSNIRFEFKQEGNGKIIIATAVGITALKAPNKNLISKGVGSSVFVDFVNTNKYVVSGDLEESITVQNATGVSITFDTNKIFNLPTAPGTGNITNDLTGAKIGIVQKIYHNNSSAPTFPAGWVNIGGTYTNSVLNIIFAEWVESSRVEYWIVKG